MELETNLIYCGDNLEIMRKFPENSVDLVYLDPPFFSNKTYEIIWGNGAELAVFKDRWKGGIKHYIGWMIPRIREMYRVLKDTGSIYLHCDWHASHRLRVVMDDIFGEDNFQNEIIWFYSVGGKSKRRFARKHDNIFFYSKGKNWTFRGEDVATVSRKTGSKSFGGKIGVDELGRKYQDKRTKNGKYYRYYLEAGKIPEDVWEIQSIQSQSKERLGYPTQKPEELLERIIRASSNPGDIVLDPFCGCGTTLVVAHELGRKWIGIDVSPKACRLMETRLNKIGVSPVRIIGAPKTVAELKKITPLEFQHWVIDRIGGTPSKKAVDDMGIDGYTFMDYDPVQAKQSERVGRNVVDNFETAIRRKGKTKGYIIAFSFTKGAYEEVARTQQENGLEIKLVRVDEMDKYF
jgi:DNA modification methylase